MEIIKTLSPNSRMVDRLDDAEVVEFDARAANVAVNGHHVSEAGSATEEVEQLSAALLYANRIIAFDSDSSMAHAYDALRNQLLNEPEDRDTRVISVTAPTRGCGATVTAVNLAFSFARVPGTSVLLVDANARRPAVGDVLGLPDEPLLDDPLGGWLTSVGLRGLDIHLLRAAWGPGKVPQAADLARMRAQVRYARQALKPTITLLDLPPMLSSDEAVPFVDESDTVVFVLAVNRSKLSELEICRSYLKPGKGMQVVLNKTKRHGL